MDFINFIYTYEGEQPHTKQTTPTPTHSFPVCMPQAATLRQGRQNSVSAGTAWAGDSGVLLALSAIAEAGRLELIGSKLESKFFEESVLRFFQFNLTDYTLPSSGHKGGDTGWQKAKLWNNRNGGTYS